MIYYLWDYLLDIVFTNELHELLLMMILQQWWPRCRYFTLAKHPVCHGISVKRSWGVLARHFSIANLTNGCLGAPTRPYAMISTIPRNCIVGS